MSARGSALSIDVPIHREDALHFLGYRGHTPGPRIQSMLVRVLEEARSLVAPRGLYRIVPAEHAEELGLRLEPGASLALGLVTIGFDLERRVTRCLATGETTHALLLDAAGSAAAEEAAEVLERRILTGALAPGHAAVPRRFSPGYGRWPVTAQRALFAMLPHDAIDVRLLPSCLMSPRKSVSFAVRLGAGEDSVIPESCRTRRCADCDLATCPYREPGAPPA